MRAASKDFAVDDKEVHAAMWLPWRSLLDAWVRAGRPTTEKNVPLTGVRELPADKTKVGKNLLKWLDLYRSGRGFACKLDGDELKIGV